MKKFSKTCIFVILIYMFTFQNFLQSIIPGFSYFDELVSICIIPIIIFKIINIKKKNNGRKIYEYIKKFDIIMIICLIMMFLIGILGNVIYKYQTNLYVFMDIVLIFKFFGAYLLSQFIFNFKEIDLEKISKHVKGIMIFILIGTIIDYIFKINLTDTIRWGFHSNKFIYETPTSLAAEMVFLLALYIMTSKKIDIKYIIIDLIILISTARTKAIAFSIIAIILYLYQMKFDKKINIKLILILGGIGILLSINKLKYYFIDLANESARYLLLETSLKIIKDYFPIGCGFGTFGSYVSGLNYSPLYQNYNIHNYLGLTKENPAFISDSFWAMIAGQFGMTGIIIWIILIYVIFKKIQQSYNKEIRFIYISKIIVLMYLLISSMAESAFVNSFAIPFAIILGISTNKTYNKNKQYNKSFGAEKC